MSTTTKLQRIELNSFKGIDESKPVIIDFNTTDKNIVYLQGDQGVNKTSTLEGIMWLMGASFDVNIKELYNHSTPIDEELLFEHNEQQFKVIAKGDKIVVKSLREGDGSTNDKWVNEASPKDLLAKIFKKCIISQSLRYEKSEKQIEWLSSLFPLPKDVKESIASAQVKIKTMRTVDRPRIGQEAKSFETLLKNNPLYAEYQEKGEALEKEIKKLDKAQDKLDVKDVSLRHQQFIQAEQKIITLNEKAVEQQNSINDIKKAIEDLQIKLKLKESELEQTNESIIIGNDYIINNKKVLAEYKKAMDLQEESAGITLRINNFEELKKNLDLYNSKSEEYIQVDSNIKAVVKTINDLKADYIPVIEGVEVVSEEEIENGEVVKEIGIFYNGNCIRTVCGSEYITALIKIIRASGSRYVFIDDLATYGTETIEYINSLAAEIKEEGGVIFASEMERGSELIITMEDQIK